MENININTLRFLSVLNGLAEKSKSGILPLDAYNGPQTGIIYDPSIEFEERGDASIKVHPVVSAIGFPDGVREVCYYGEDDEDAINEEFQVFVEVDSCPAMDYPNVSCAVYLRNHEAEAKLAGAVPGHLYQRIEIRDGHWFLT